MQVYNVALTEEHIQAVLMQVYNVALTEAPTQAVQNQFQNRNALL